MTQNDKKNPQTILKLTKMCEKSVKNLEKVYISDYNSNYLGEMDFKAKM